MRLEESGRILLREHIVKMTIENIEGSWGGLPDKTGSQDDRGYSEALREVRDHFGIDLNSERSKVFRDGQVTLVYSIFDENIHVYAFCQSFCCNLVSIDGGLRNGLHARRRIFQST